jgi:hypothetical protein
MNAASSYAEFASSKGQFVCLRIPDHSIERSGHRGYYRGTVPVVSYYVIDTWGQKKNGLRLENTHPVTNFSIAGFIFGTPSLVCRP